MILRSTIVCALWLVASCAALWISVPAAAADVAAVSAADKLDFHRDIAPIFQAHCAECHGEKQAKADLNVSNRDALMSYVAAGDLESSSLWTDYLTTDDPEMRMPPESHGKPLSAVELAAIRVWIQDGAAWPDAPATASEATKKGPVAERSPVQKALTFAGYFHPAVVHFPIALLLVSNLFVLLSFVNRSTFEPAAFHLLWLGTVAAIASCVLGWYFAEVRGYGDAWSTSFTEDAIQRHRVTGIVLSILAVILTGVAAAARNRNRSDLRVGWLIGSALLALLVSVTGHQGGELTYGEDLYGRAYKAAYGEAAAAESADKPATFDKPASADAEKAEKPSAESDTAAPGA